MAPIDELLNTFPKVDAISINWRKYALDDMERITRHRPLTSLSIWELDFIGQLELLDRLTKLFERISCSGIRLTTVGLHCIGHQQQLPHQSQAQQIRKLIGPIFKQNLFPSLQALNLSLLNFQATVMSTDPTTRYRYSKHNYFSGLAQRTQVLFGDSNMLFELLADYSPLMVSQEQLVKLFLIIDNHPKPRHEGMAEVYSKLHWDCRLMRNSNKIGSILMDLDNVPTSFVLTLSGWLDDVQIMNDTLRRESGRFAIDVDDSTFRHLHFCNQKSREGSRRVFIAAEELNA
jgi:hypothetical protein